MDERITNTADLEISSANKKGTLAIDLNGFAEKEHTHNFNIRYDVLFKGDAEQNINYTLNQPISKYQFLIVFGAGRLNGHFAQKNGTWLKVDDIDFSDPLSPCAVCFAKGASVAISIPNENTFKVIMTETGRTGWENTCIREIVGVY